MSLAVMEKETAPTRARSAVRNAGMAALVTLGFVLVGTPAYATTTTGPNYGTAITQARDEGLKVLTDNVLLLLALPVAWVGYRVARKVIEKIG